MDIAAEDVRTNGGGGRRPSDMARLLLAIGLDPPRARARDQQADLAGARLLSEVLHRLAAIDPEPAEIEETLDTIIAQIGAPTGPTRGVAALFLEEWSQALRTEGYWSWLIAEALVAADRTDGSWRRRNRGDL